MATVRTNILNEFDSRMLAINGTGGYITTLSDVIRVAEFINEENEDFTAFPAMFYTVSTISTDYEVGNRILETMVVDSFTLFDEKKTPESIDDYISDVYTALATNDNDVKMNGLADFFVIDGVPEGGWLEEENLTSVNIRFTCQYRRSATTR